MRSVEQYAHDRFFFAHTEIKESKRSSLFSQTRCYSLTCGRFLRETACNPVAEEFGAIQNETLKIFLAMTKKINWAPYLVILLVGRVDKTKSDN